MEDPTRIPYNWGYHQIMMYLFNPRPLYLGKLSLHRVDLWCAQQQIRNSQEDLKIPSGKLTYWPEYPDFPYTPEV